MEWNLCDVTEEQEQKRSVELTTFNMLDLYGDFIKENHTPGEFRAFTEQWCEKHQAELQ